MFENVDDNGDGPWVYYTHLRAFGSGELKMYLQSMFRAKTRKISQFFHLKIVILSRRNYKILHRPVNDMKKLIIQHTLASGRLCFK